MVCYERFIDSINKAMKKNSKGDSSIDKNRQLTVATKYSDFGNVKYLFRCSFDGYDKTNFSVLDIIELQDDTYFDINSNSSFWDKNDNVKSLIKISFDDNSAVITSSKRINTEKGNKIKDLKRIVYNYDKDFATEYSLEDGSSRSIDVDNIFAAIESKNVELFFSGMLNYKSNNQGKRKP